MTGRKLIGRVLLGVAIALAFSLPLAAQAGETPAERPHHAKTDHQQGPRGVLAQFPGGPLALFVGGLVKRVAGLQADLNLSDEQQRKICDAFRGHRRQCADQVKELWLKRNALRDTVLAHDSDEAAIRKAADELGKEIGDAAVLAAKVKGEVAATLTDEQRARIKQFISDCDKAEEEFYHQAVERMEKRAAAKAEK